MNLRFQRINNSTIGSFEFTQGTIYFNDADNLIYVGTGNGSGTSNYKVYSGARDINWDNANSILSFTNASGTSVSIDFDNLVGFDDFTALRDGIGLVESKVGDVSVYSFGANGIAGTEYLDSSDSSTVIGALKTLDDAVKVARQNAGVTSFAGKTGAITLAPTNETNGAINLSISGGDTSVLSASMYGINTAAYETKEYFVGIDNSTDASTNDTIKGAKKYTAEVLGPDNDASNHATVYGTRKWVEETIGDGNDPPTAVTVHGVINKAQAVKTELLGNATSDSSASKTIEGLIKKINDTSANTTLHLYSGDSGTTEATHVRADGTTYRLVQGSDATKAVATFNIEKDSFVQDGSVRNFTTDEDASTATGDPSAKAGHYIQLVIKTTDASVEKNLWIPAESLVDSYTADNTGKNVTVDVNNTTNKISASVATSAGTAQVNFGSATATTLATIADQAVNIKLDTLETVSANTVGGVQLSESNNVLGASLIDNAVTTAKIVDGNVTEDKLSSGVSTKLNGAVQTVTGETAISNPSTDYIDVKVSAAKTGTDVALTTTYSLTIHDVSTATSSSNGLADASTVKTYVQTYVGEQLTWTEWPA